MIFFELCERAAQRPWISFTDRMGDGRQIDAQAAGLRQSFRAEHRQGWRTAADSCGLELIDDHIVTTLAQRLDSVFVVPSLCDAVAKHDFGLPRDQLVALHERPRVEDPAATVRFKHQNMKVRHAGSVSACLLMTNCCEWSIADFELISVELKDVVELFSSDVFIRRDHEMAERVCVSRKIRKKVCIAHRFEIASENLDGFVVIVFQHMRDSIACTAGADPGLLEDHLTPP